MQCLRILIIVVLIASASGCGKKKKGKKGLKSCGDTVTCKVGKDVKQDPYSASGDGAVAACSDLNCNFDQSCCWSNYDQDQLDWQHGSGAWETAKIQNKNSFGTTSMADGGYLLTSSDKVLTSGQAVLYSCPITCSNGDITVQLKHWQTSDTTIQVCSYTDTPSNCQTLTGASGSSDTATVHAGQNQQGQRMAIIAKGLTKGSVAIIDDINVSCTPCADTTTTIITDAPTPAPTAAPAANPPCKEINCNFESGNPCSYSQSSAGGNAFKNWGVESAPYNNPLTGVKKTTDKQGQKFAASYLKKKGEKTIMSTNANFDKDYVVKMDYYKATEGVNLKGCCDSESSCPFDTTPDVQTSHYKNWRSAAFACPANTKQVLFVSDNQRGVSEGAVAIDNIQLLQSAGGSPDSASTPACTS